MAIVLGRIDLKRLGSFGDSANALVSYSRDVTANDVLATVRSLAGAEPIKKRLKTCLLFGMGAQPRSTFGALEREKGVAVLFYRSMLRGPLALLRPIVASYEGVVRVEDPEKLEAVFGSLMDRSMVGLYCCAPENETAIVAAMRRGDSGFDFGLKNDPAYLLYVVDADNAESATGIHEIVSYGREAPRSLIPERLRES